jgi:hypothetical protein
MNRPRRISCQLVIPDILLSLALTARAPVIMRVCEVRS